MDICLLRMEKQFYLICDLFIRILPIIACLEEFFQTKIQLFIISTIFSVIFDIK